MSNSDAAGSESSSSNPIPPPIQDSPRHRGRGRELSPHVNPRGRGSPPMHPWEMALFSQPPPRTPPTIGAPGRTAFGPYRPPPHQQWPFLGPSHGPGGSRGLGFQAVPVGGGGGGGPSGGLRIGRSPAGKKRGRDGGAGSSASAGNQGGGNAYQYCSVCNKGFSSSKALFGHMRSHPDRGWKGVHPPPAFRAEEEFADLHLAAEEEAGEDAGDNEGNFRVPDLNQPPPPDSN
ncbi:translation initiation factor IF-2-like [Salvia divinorum]|uniref:Translation initiation factor IF-2-like n=1 Tax=Salvia divinorum TaxID=28513 RepID=A0ABD1FYF1_SALDI